MVSIQISSSRDLFVTYLRPRRWRVVLLAVLLFSSIGLQVYNPQILKSFIDSATSGGTLRTLSAAATLFIVVALVQQVLSVAATYVSENVGWQATNDLRADLLLHSLRLDQTFHKTRTPGELIERIDGDVTALATFFSKFVIEVLGNLLLLIGVLVVMWSVDWRIGVLLTVFAAIVLITMSRLQNFAAPSWKIARQTSAELYGFIEERLAGTEDIRSSGAKDFTMRRLYQHLTANYNAEWWARIKGRVVWVASHMLFTLGTGAALVVGAYLYWAGTMTIGTIYLVVFYTGLLIHPLRTIAQRIEDFQKAGAGILRVRELLNERSTLPDTGTATLPSGPLAVAFDQVVFGYEDDKPVLDGVVFDLQPGQVLGVLGRTGSGKTTVTRLLQRFYDPQGGAIRLGGVDVRDVRLNDLRRRIGIVTQEVQLFHATIRDNLTFFDTTIADDRILQAIDDLGLGPWYRTLPDGLDTMLATGSGGLSAGEAQLLAFTRIFLRDPGLVLLDEASSRLDPATEQLIERAVDRLLTNRTGIVIAHRLHTVHRADAILILEDGHVAEYGARLDLMRDPDSRFSALLRAGLEEVLA